MELGEHDGYRWFEIVPETPGLERLAGALPEIVVGKYVAITSFDSGPLRLSSEQLAKGWTSVADVAYSPQVQDPKDIPADQYDEWWIFDAPAKMESSRMFINNTGFRLSTPKDTVDDPTWDLAAQQHWAGVQRGWQDELWKLVRENEPTSYLASNGQLIFITRDTDLAARVEEWLRSQRELGQQDRKRYLPD